MKVQSIVIVALVIFSAMVVDCGPTNPDMDLKCRDYAAAKHIDVSKVWNMVIVSLTGDGCLDICLNKFRNFGFPYGDRPNTCCCGYKEYN